VQKRPFRLVVAGDCSGGGLAAACAVHARDTQGPEILVREPGDLHFNAIEETLDKITPNFGQLMRHIESLGFVPERLVPTFASPAGLQDVDDYTLGNRVTIFARRRV
jgi:acetyl esterase/lipase